MALEQHDRPLDHVGVPHAYDGVFTCRHQDVVGATVVKGGGALGGSEVGLSLTPQVAHEEGGASVPGAGHKEP